MPIEYSQAPESSVVECAFGNYMIDFISTDDLADSFEAGPERDAIARARDGHGIVMVCLHDRGTFIASIKASIEALATAQAAILCRDKIKMAALYEAARTSMDKHADCQTSDCQTSGRHGVQSP